MRQSPIHQFAYSIDESAEISGLGRTKIYEEIKAKRLIARKCGKRTIILLSDAKAWLQGLPRLGGGSES